MNDRFEFDQKSRKERKEMGSRRVGGGGGVKRLIDLETVPTESFIPFRWRNSCYNIHDYLEEC